MLRFIEVTVKLYIIKVVITLFFLYLSASTSYGQYKVSANEVGKYITTMSNADDGQMHFGTRDGECGYYDGLIAKVNQRLPSVNRLVDDGEVIWICTEKGLYKKSLDKIENISGSHLQVLDYDYKNDLIIAKQGVYTSGASGYEPSRKDRMPIFGNVQKTQIEYTDSKTYLLLDDKLYCKSRWWKLQTDSVIGIAIKDKELIVAKSNGIFDEVDTVLHSLYIDSTAHVLVTKDDRLYIANNNFISEIFDDRIRNIYSLNSQDITTLHEDRWHNIWAARSNYLYKISPSLYDQSIELEILTINNLKNKSSVKLNDSSPSLKIQYHGVQLTSPQYIRYQSRLEGHSDWSESTVDKEMFYGNIPPGNYKYRLRATLDGENFTYTDEIDIDVSSPMASWVWLTLFLAALSILAIAYFANRRLTTFKAKMSSEKKKLEDKNKLLTLEQKALQLQMNPHFIFNALNSIKGQMALGDVKSARQSITKFAHLMRSTLDMSREDSISLNQEITYLNRYLNLEQWVNQDIFAFEIEIDEALSQDSMIPTMLIQPFVENAIKHAFKGMEIKGRLLVKFIKFESQIIIKIIDNGVGMPENLTNSDHKSVAISVVKDRLAIKFPKHKGDLVNITSPSSLGNGTEVNVTIPNAAI